MSTRSIKHFSLRYISNRYRLRAVINFRPNHFVTTFVDRDENLYIYDDLCGIEEISHSVDKVETTIYSLIEEF